MALNEFFEGRTVIRLISRINGTVENATDYEPRTPDDVSTPGRWELLLSFAQAHPSIFDIEFADTPSKTDADGKGNYTKQQLDKMGVPKLNKILEDHNLSGMPSREAAVSAILAAQGAKG